MINHQEVIGVYIIYIDISHKKAYEKQLLEFKKILENNSEGVVITDIGGDIRWINNAFSEITGYSLKEIIGNKTNILKSGIHDKEFYINMWSQLVNKGKWSGEIWNKNKKGEIYSEWLTINTIKDDSTNKVSYVGIFKDLSEKKRIDRRMNDLQQKDVLTGLYNRNYFLEIVDTFSCNCSLKDESFSIIFIDVQGLKEINDSLGHLLGDKLLIEISRRLITLVEDKYLLARFSGHEFALLYKTIAGRSDTYFFAKQLLERIKVPFTIDSTILHINVNIGISRFPEDAVDTETLIRYADIAMSRAKERSENKICFYNKNMSKEIDEKFLLANYLRSAISNDELNVYYQPIFDIKNPENIVGAEALIRWENPILGTVPPDRFIPLAEKTGQISAVGEWVLNQVCKQIHLWQCRGCHMVPIAVNISVKQLEKKGFHQIVADIIKENHIKPACIELEITESVSSGELVTIVQNLKRLKGTGIKISMDDFGTGFSSLGQLDIFELDKLKIDKIFIDDIISLSKKQKLVKSIIAMAEGLDLAVVAEGIETSEQLLYLRKLGCQMGQGFLISRPLLVEEMEYLLNSRKH
jgi:diguanylate cyclase (GGDEF)-like protein/PAS domain S-box-containing protein